MPLYNPKKSWWSWEHRLNSLCFAIKTSTSLKLYSITTSIFAILRFSEILACCGFRSCLAKDLPTSCAKFLAAVRKFCSCTVAWKLNCFSALKKKQTLKTKILGRSIGTYLNSDTVPNATIIKIQYYKCLLAYEKS